MEAPDILARLKELALACGFTQAGTLDAATVKVRQEVRDSCASDKCHSYGKNWSCPPAIGSLEKCQNEIRQYQTGLILQTTGSVEDSFDYEAITRIGEKHNACLQAFQEKLTTNPSPLTPRPSPLAPNPYLLLGAGACKNCEQCTCPHLPCPTPDKMVISMEAMGLLVSELCTANNVPYYYGPNTITFVGCVLLRL